MLGPVKPGCCYTPCSAPKGNETSKVHVTWPYTSILRMNSTVCEELHLLLHRYNEFELQHRGIAYVAWSQIMDGYKDRAPNVYGICYGVGSLIAPIYEGVSRERLSVVVSPSRQVGIGIRLDVTVGIVILLLAPYYEQPR